MTITLALPSKGRLKDQATEVFANAGLVVVQAGDERSYRARVDGRDDIEIKLLSASEIATELGAGNLDLGVTGEDLIREKLADCDAKVAVSARLPFGFADVVVAVPDCWWDVETMADLDDVAADFRQRHGRRLRIATKYWRLTQQFFSHAHGIQVYRIVESLGATEGAPAAGSADIIVDITTSGSTLKSNHLKVLTDGVILKSQACMVTSLKGRGEDEQRAIEAIAERVRAATG
ncbi:ATP phosphoribosyltransferase [Arvimicrobium flavum]|uniref:ATP phosphoribosyltransferase n=1 Tax=Arvimicrobium flavum TaxID=3393320 RepID=UPI00237B4CF1|nr:ATP phosphoribosyltransferase [Mesorhizobium shangrilense]